MKSTNSNAFPANSSSETGATQHSVLPCFELPQFDTTNLAVVRRAFQKSTLCVLHQAWLPKQQAHFAPASVRTGWRGDSMLALAELTDADIFSDVTGPGQRAWELGDTFEMFLQSDRREDYVELHVTPNNHRLQLRFENVAMVQRVRTTGSLEGALLSGDVFSSATWTKPEAQQGFVLAEVPARLICSSRHSLAGSRWRFSFSRYDYTHGQDEPVISSTSPHAKPDFHRRDEWGVLAFE